MICEFQKQHELDYAAKTAAVLKQVADRRKTMHEKNASTALDNTADDIQEARDDNGGDDARAPSSQHTKASGRTLSLGGSQIVREDSSSVMYNFGVGPRFAYVSASARAPK